MADINKNINLDPDMPSPELDKVTLTPAQKTKGLKPYSFKPFLVEISG